MMPSGNGASTSMANELRSSRLWSGVLMITGSALMVGFMLMHPSVHAHGDGAIEEMRRIAGVNAGVHGTLIGVMGVVFVGLLGLCERMGWSLVPVRAGLVAYGAGAVGACGAALLNGFVVPALFMGHGAAEHATAEQAHVMADLCHMVAASLAMLSVIGMSGGVLIWSGALLAHPARLGAGAVFARILGALGLACGGLPIAGLLAGHLHMDVHGFSAFVILQGVWCIGAAAALIKGR